MWVIKCHNVGNNCFVLQYMQVYLFELSLETLRLFFKCSTKIFTFVQCL